ncbi:hypothetical protein FHL15_006021 [Xylaria flabelliformis]|uniref:Uncharacterized protein n=1 Tax=Xylaria flabelliformis TaxID=2512241 RepID=A0A553HYZ5_9PEZI|nr:hypothetical protein FHL15_006021 [Xylaria flabelliformis]
MGQGMVPCMACPRADSSISPADESNVGEETPSARSDATPRQENIGSHRDPGTAERNEVPSTRNDEDNAREPTPTTSSRASEQQPENQTTTASEETNTSHQPVVSSSSRAYKEEETPSGYEGGSEKEEERGRKRKRERRKKKKRVKRVKRDGPDPKRSENIPSDTSNTSDATRVSSDEFN